MLLTVVALDENNSIFPLAIVLVECENKETCSWFFHFFEEYFGPFDNQLPLTFMSDRQKVLFVLLTNVPFLLSYDLTANLLFALIKLC